LRADDQGLLAEDLLPENRALAAALRRAVAAGWPADGAEPAGAMADAATVLWTRFLKFDSADPGWPDRDRCVLACAGGERLWRMLRHLTGDMVPAAEPESLPEVAAPGQGFGTIVGMALAERFLATRFGSALVDHRTWLLASDADLAQGVSHEAASLACQFRLAKLTVLWDESAEPAMTGTLRRFTAYGWTTKRVDANDHAALAAALGMALRSRKPTLIACRAVQATDSADLPPERLAAYWRAIGARGAAPRRAWLRRHAHHTGRDEFDRVVAGRLPERLAEALADVKRALGAAGGRMATRAASDRVLEMLAPALPELVGGAARPGAAATPSAGGFARKFLHFGTREHGMAAAMNGMAAHGGVLPYGGTSWHLADSLRPALRLAASMRSRVVHVLTPDPSGRQRPTLEQLASLRAVPNLHVLRPACPIETAECWELALRRHDGPSLLVLDDDELPALRLALAQSGVESGAPENRCADGGYVVAEADGPRRATLIATGAEVTLAMAARTRLAAERIAVAVVSLPCWDLFARAGSAHREAVLGDALRFGIEAGSAFGWDRWLGPGGVFVGCEDDGSAADLTPEAIAAIVRERLVTA
jgi:transketolase